MGARSWPPLAPTASWLNALDDPSARLLTRQSLTVASMVGFISLSGIASRNGILLIAHYLHLVRHEGERFTPEMVERAGRERVAPMLMTALTAGIALVPLVLAAGEPGKEILYPVATVILGGLISSTLLDFFVHPALFWCFGRAQAGQMTACVSPAALVNGGTELDAYLPSGNAFSGAGNVATDWTGQGTKIATPFVRLPGLIHGQCVTSNGDSYFSIRLTPGQGPRTKTIPGDILIGKSVLKSWGLHLIDVNLTEGDLITLAGRQSQAWLAKR